MQLYASYSLEGNEGDPGEEEADDGDDAAHEGDDAQRQDVARRQLQGGTWYR